jgi:3-methyladenine DNA glycosylase AlkD
MEKCQRELNKLKNRAQAKVLARFFKTGKGEYGEGDIFLGLKSEQIKKVAKKYQEFGLESIQSLLDSEIHEHRVCALRISIFQYKKLKKLKLEKKIVNFYLKNSKRINSWDLVDISAHYILGDYFLNKDKKILYKFARSKNLWERRISIISTFAFIRAGKFEDTFNISKILLTDKHDLIYKAVGWMLREVGKRDQKAQEIFLKKHYKKMPRTMLRYAIEKFSFKKRKLYLKK